MPPLRRPATVLWVAPPERQGDGRDVVERSGFAVREPPRGADPVRTISDLAPDAAVLAIPPSTASWGDWRSALGAGTARVPVVALASPAEIAARREGPAGPLWVPEPVCPEALLSTLWFAVRLRRAERSLESARVRALARARDEALTAVARQLAPALSRIEINAGGALAGADPVLRARVLTIREAAATARRQLEDLSLAQGVARGRIPPEAEALDVEPTIRAALQLFDGAAAARDVRLDADVQPGLGARGDRTALLRALAALVDNAVRVSPRGGAVRVRARAEGTYVHVVVEDEGPGIPPERAAALLQPVWERGGDRRVRPGTGLVLARAVAEAGGGRLWIEEGRRRGTAVHLALACALARG